MTRLDRYGEPLDDEPDETHRCDNGWRDYDNAVPCLECRPHLGPERRRRRLGDDPGGNR